MVEMMQQIDTWKAGGRYHLMAEFFKNAWQKYLSPLLEALFITLVILLVFRSKFAV